MGMMGQMQGIHTAARPARNPINNSHHSDFPARSSPDPNDRSSSMTGAQRSISEVRGEGLEVRDMTDAESDTATEAESMTAIEAELRLSAGADTAAAANSSLFTFPFSLKTGLLPLCFNSTSDGGIQLA